MSDSQSENPMEADREDTVMKPEVGVTSEVGTSGFSGSEMPEQEAASEVGTPACSWNEQAEQLSFLDEPDVFTPGDSPEEPVEPEMLPYNPASGAVYTQDSSETSDSSFVQEPADQPGMVIRRVRTESSDASAKPKERGFLYTLLDTTRFISLGLLIGILLVVFVVQRNDVYGYSMEPTLYDGDAVFVEMISKYTNSYKRGEIVTVNATGMEGYSKQEKLIKRIIGRPGDTITIKDGQVYLNGALLDEPYLAEGTKTYVSADGTAKGYDNVVLGPDQYFIMGDNRGASLDSRVIGPVTVDRIKAHVILRIYPFDKVGLF